MFDELTYEPGRWHMFGALGLHAPLSHSAGDPLLSLGQGVDGEHDVVHALNAPNGWHTIVSQSCSSTHRS